MFDFFKKGKQINSQEKKYDLMTSSELHEFGLQLAVENVLKPKQFDILEVQPKLFVYPHVVAQVDNELFFFAITTAIAPNYGTLENGMRDELIRHAKRFCANPVFFGISLTPIDEEQRRLSIAVRHAGFNMSYGDPVFLDGSEDEDIPAVGTEAYRRYCLNAIRRLYVRRDTAVLEPLIAGRCEMHSSWVQTPMSGKEEIIDYFRNKARSLPDEYGRMRADIVKLIGSSPINANVQVQDEFYHSAKVIVPAETGRFCLLVFQQKENEMVKALIDIDIDSNGFISKISLNMPEIYKFENAD